MSNDDGSCYPRRRWRVAALVAVVATASVAGIAWWLPVGSPGRVGRGAPAHGSGPAGPGSRRDAGPVGLALLPTRADVAAASAAAARFVVAWWSEDWRRTAGVGPPVGGLVVPGSDLAAVAPGAPVLDDGARRLQRVVTVEAPQVAVIDISAEGVGVAVSAVVRARSTLGSAATTQAAEVLLVRAGGSWLVARVDQ